MDDGSEGNEPKANKNDGKLLVVFSAVLVVAVMTIALILASGALAPGEKDLHDSDDTNLHVSEDKLVSGVASDFILNQSDIGADWIASVPVENPEFIDSPQVTSSSYVHLKQLNSSGDVHFRMDILVVVFGSIDNASAFYDQCIDLYHQESFTNISIGDRGAIVDGSQLTMGQGVKWLFFLEDNVVCTIQCENMTSDDTLPNELLIDLASKVEAKIA